MEVYIPYIIDHLPRLTFMTFAAYHAARILAEVAIVVVNAILNNIFGDYDDGQQK